MLTPYLAIDLDNLEQNIATMATAAQQLRVRVRPHFKTHKSPLVARKQMAAGAIGITCATLGEAETAIQNGLTDILISREITGRDKLKRLAGLAHHADLKVVVDHPTQVHDLAAALHEQKAAIGVLIEINIGQNRCGLDPDDLKGILDLVRLIAHAPGLTFRGFQGYEGHLVLMADEAERRTSVQAANARLMQVVQAAAAAGYPSAIVTGGGTGTALITGSIPGMTEIQPGTYATMDSTYSKIMGQLFQPAVWVATTVISRPARDRLIVDAGSKAISTDYGPPEIIGHPDWVYQAAGDEYGLLRQVEGQPIDAGIGEEIRLYPSHGCTTFNLYDLAYGFRQGRLEIDIPVAGRGKSY